MGSKMILSDLVLPSRAGQHWLFSGLDSYVHCFDKNHFKSYPYEIDYVYNSRGFRDQEWPDSTQDLKNAVWCIGDSFTVGLGAPVEHTWPRRLGKKSGQRIINISMDGASNQWIARTVEKIVCEIDPTNIVIMWSYTHRRESDNNALDDECRRMYFEEKQTELNPAADWQDFLNCKSRVDSITKSVQFAVPCFHPEILNVYKCWNSIKGQDWPPAPNTLKELSLLPQWILNELTDLHNLTHQIQQTLELNLFHVDNLDFARDGCHFDIVTADWIAELALSQLNL